MHDLNPWADYVSVCTFPLRESHRAHNLVDTLDAQGIDAFVLPKDESDDEAADGLTVLVQPSDEARARLITEAFRRDYDAAVDYLVARGSGTLWERSKRAGPLLGIPMFIAVLGAMQLPTLALGSNPYSNPTNEIWSGIGLLVTGLGMCAGMVALLRKT